MDASEPLLEAARPQVERSGCQLGDYGAARQQLLVVAGDGGAEASDGAEQLVDGFLLHGGVAGLRGEASAGGRPRPTGSAGFPGADRPFSQRAAGVFSCDVIR